MIWMGNDLSLINDWATYLKGIHLQHGMGSLLRWTGALERTHVPPLAPARPDASLRESVWDVAQVPESIPLSHLSYLRGMRCAQTLTPLLHQPLSLSLSVVLLLYLSLSRPFSVLFIYFFFIHHFPRLQKHSLNSVFRGAWGSQQH